MPYSSRNIQGGNLGPGDFVAANPNLGADDKSIAMLIKYVGSAESGTVEVDSSGDIVLLAGDVGSEVSTDMPSETGGTAGTIDVSDANANEVGDVIDAINAHADWIAVLIDATTGELTEAKGGSGAAFLDQGPIQAKVAKGIPIYWDTSAAWRDAVLVAPDALRTDIRPYQTNEPGAASASYAKGGVDPAKPFQGRSTFIYDVSWLSTYGSGTSALAIYSEDPTQTDDRSTKASKQVYGEASGNTTVRVNHEFRNGLEGERGRRLLVAVENSAAQSVVNLGVSGELQRKLN
jgi:hypothetical protein